MTKQHFEQLAEVIRVLRNNHGASIPAEALVSEISDMCSRINGRFDVGRFARACEPTKQERATEAETLGLHEGVELVGTR